jgi:hypothetical protein
VIAANLEARAVRDYSPRVRFVAFSSKACHRTAHLLASGKRVKTTIYSLVLLQAEPETALEKRGQLIKRVKNFQPHEKQRCDHQIITKMHAGFETNAFRGLCLICGRP